MDYEILKILIRNASNQSLRIFRQYKLGYLLDMAYENYFLIDTQSAYDAAAVSHPRTSFLTLTLGLRYCSQILQ